MACGKAKAAAGSHDVDDPMYLFSDFLFRALRENVLMIKAPVKRQFIAKFRL